MSKARNTAAWGQYQPKRKNLVINGGFNVWQRGTSFSSPVTGGFMADRWKIFAIGGGAFSGSKSTLTPTTTGSILIGTTVVDSTEAAGDVYGIENKIEGYDADILRYGTASAVDCTVSFWVRSETKTGIFCISLRNGATDRSYVAEYTINSAATWEYKTITIPGDTSGTWLTNNGIGVRLSFTIQSGSTFETTADTWSAGNFVGTSNQVNGMDSTSNQMRFKDIQLEVGSESTDFEYRPFAEELALCQRYYEKSYNQDDAPGTITTAGSAWVYISNITNAQHAHGTNQHFAVVKRGTPSITAYSPNTGTSTKLYDITAGADAFAALGRVGVRSFAWWIQQSDSTTSTTAQIEMQWTADAEL